ncbi:Uncharacterised protein [Mycobacteroides abscessus subsp. abscessus]|nr:Uncharacterised protein [Mycobacteroides abscessus subsp. abscessus]
MPTDSGGAAGSPKLTWTSTPLATNACPSASPLPTVSASGCT